MIRTLISGVLPIIAANKLEFIKKGGLENGKATVREEESSPSLAFLSLSGWTNNKIAMKLD